MSDRRWLVVAVGVLVATVLVPGTGGFGSVAADRSVQVAVAEDNRALLGIDTDRIDRCGDAQRALTVENRLDTDLHTIEAEVVRDGEFRAEVTAVPERLGTGEAAGVRVRVTPEGSDDPPEGNASGELTLRVAAIGEDVEIALTRPVAVECPEPAPTAGSTGTSGG